MKKTVLYLALTAAVLCTGSCRGTANDDGAVKVVSYNIRVGTARDHANGWQFRHPATDAMLREVSPDVFGLQEAMDFQIEYIHTLLPQYECVGVGREDGKNKGEHMSIFYRKDRIELLDWGTYWLSETPEVPSKGWDAAYIRTATWTKMKVKATGKEFFYVNTHLDNEGAEARRNGLALIVERIAGMNPGGYPMILTGDFNTVPSDECFTDLNRIMKNARTVAEKTTDGHSYNGWGKPEDFKIIDYIYFSGFSSCPEFKVLNGTYAGVPYISDHYPVCSVLKF